MPLLPADFDHTDAIVLKKQSGLPLPGLLAATGEGRGDASRWGKG